MIGLGDTRVTGRVCRFVVPTSGFWGGESDDTGIVSLAVHDRLCPAVRGRSGKAGARDERQGAGEGGRRRRKNHSKQPN